MGIILFLSIFIGISVINFLMAKLELSGNRLRFHNIVGQRTFSMENFEVLARNYIVKGKAHMIDAQKVILKGKTQGMQTMDDAIMALVERGYIDAHNAYLKVSDKDRFLHLLKHPPSDFTGVL